MRKITSFAAAVAVLVLIGIDAWLSMRTLTPGAAAAGSTFNRLMVTGANGSPSHSSDYLIGPTE